MEFDVLDSREVWWQTTNEYELRFDDGEVKQYRASENPKGTEFFVLTSDGWEELEDADEYDDAFYEAWSEGELN